jgi:peptidoglycan hydrolase-like protein with peptidoglycan-binding domain
MLSELGYDLSNGPNDKTKGIDGIFGMKTWKAVVDFQRKNNLEPDGVVGELTMAALEKATSKAGYTIKVTASLLNVRSGPGIENHVVGMIRKDATYKLLEIKDGWGRISSPAGWVSLSYVIAI